ncbi:uncharacterized protein LOC121388130 isoform X2 [Gigantopelta aegis]|uniref:uncharacterized protein LOC121388130 isoform X2 n=1 Tax=Gigantopelta aegis TaxID=1735272 RepID=UPI001B88DEF2|nr:uncharacterized protein LOC121388130 isoform X2 [Gigantopelta aegis]
MVSILRKKINLNFKAAPNHPTPTCKLQIDWSNIDDNIIENLCILIVNDNTGDAAFSFLSLHYFEDEVSLPKIKINVSSEPFMVYVYGLERTQRRVPYFYQACASGTKKLTYTAGQSNSWKLDLEAHSVGPLSMTEHKDLVGQDPFSITQKRVRNCKRLNTTQMDLPQDVLVVLKEQEESNEIFWLTAAASKSFIKVPLDVLSPGTTTVKVYTLAKVYCKTGLMIYHKKASSLELDLKRKSSSPPTRLTDLTLEETKTLMNKALDFMSPESKMSPLNYLYRNKPPFYFHNIINIHDGIMEKYIKDYNGDAGSCINGVIGGLFFSTGLDSKTKLPPNFSFFGARRLYIPPQKIITKDTNMYFSDFYCHYEQHYVTVVVTKSGSHADDFCKGKLPQLDAQDNRFICTGNFRSFSVTMSVSVEIFYTEDINISSLVTQSSVSWSTVRIRGRGQSKKYGIPKKENCSICHL